MEVQVTDTFGLEEDVLVSIRYGTVRRQAPLESVKSHPFKFPAQLEDLSEPLKIDLLKPVASTRLVLHPKEEHYSIGFEQEDSIAMGLHVMAGAPEASETNAGAKDAGAKDSASSAKDYLEQKGLLKYVQSLLHAVIQDKPADPFSYMIEQLTAAQSKSMACERVMSRPTSAMSRPTSAVQRPPGNPTLSAVSRPTSAVQRPPGNRPQNGRPSPPEQKMVLQAPVPSKDPPSLPEPISPAKEEPQERPVRQIEPRRQDPKVEEALRKCDQGAEAKQELMQKLLSAADSGDLGVVLSSVGLDQSRQRIQGLLEQSAESGDLEAALKMAMNQKELEDILRLKTEMRQVLQGASDTGTMKTVLEEISGEQRTQKVQGELRDALFEANESGKMKQILDEMAAQRGISPAATTGTSNEAEELKVQLRDALLDANDSGKMAEVLDAMAAESQLQAELTDVMKVKMQLKDVLAEANEIGKVKEVLSQMVKEMPPAAPSAEEAQVLSELRGVLMEANDKGKLTEVLKEISSEKTAASGAAPEAAAVKSEKSEKSAKVKKGLLDAAKSGKLEQVLDDMPAPLEPVTAVPVQAVQAEQAPAQEVEALRENIRAKVEQSLANGVLEEGLVTLQRKKSQEPGGPAAPATTAPTAQPEQPAPKSPTTAEQEDLKKLGQEICGVLQEASKSGKLDEALELLRQEKEEVVQAAPEDEMEAVRNNLSSLMKDALLTGQLATALEELKTKSEEPLRITDIHAIKAKFKKLLREALEKGILASKVGMLKLIPKAPPPPTESPPDEMDVLKLHLREALQHAAEAGHLAEALASLRSGPAEGVQETMQELQNTLTEAALSGTLAETLRSLRESGSFKLTERKDSAEEVAATPQTIASPSADQVPYGTQSNEEKELEDLRNRLRNILSGAYDQGVLEEVVQQAMKTQRETASLGETLPALKAQVAQMRSESEALHSTVEKLLREKEELERDNEGLHDRLRAPGERVTHVDP